MVAKTKEVPVKDPIISKYINTRGGNTFTSKGRLPTMETVTLPVKEGDANIALKKV